MSETQEIIPVAKCDLVGMVAELFAEGYRLVQIGCSTLSGGYELTYSFDRDYRFTNLRFSVAPDEQVPSISAIYPGAFLYENEIHDLFGVEIMHIAVDYRGTLYRTALATPFSVDNVKLPEPPKPKVQLEPGKPASAGDGPGGQTG
ncbi:NADH-quinone oxidoreductase subunit C [Geomonas sp.]|uniref:NADH-quinone oxidoreductase subunit C n=1 Tax=Geomonas sp. TaxID=2651584 RepID=UPI002B460F2A|nr:NADH-quinone oxidoreductase subunit C [Geomonas sp.]HJV36593.1 NADH-quinone oxidoreductase subunit C [Geomonas sp.]